MLRQFPKALKLYDRRWTLSRLIRNLLSTEAGVYQAEGDLERAGKFLSDITAETPFEGAFFIKVLQLRLERNHEEAVRLLQARLAQFQFTSEINKGITQLQLAFAQRLAGDTAGAKLSPNRHATRWRRSANINQITTILQHGWVWLMRL